MKVLGWFLLLELMFGCARGTLAVPARAGDRNVRVVKRVLWVTSRSAWEASPWFRISDTDWPRRVVLSADGTVCLMDGRDVSDPRPQTYFACSTSWRMARP